MSQEAFVKIKMVAIVLDLEVGELQGTLVLETPSGDFSCQLDPETANQLISQLMSGPPSQESSNSPEVSLMEESDEPLSMGSPPTSVPDISEEVDDVERQLGSLLRGKLKQGKGHAVFEEEESQVP